MSTFRTLSWRRTTKSAVNISPQSKFLVVRFDFDFVLWHKKPITTARWQNSMLLCSPLDGTIYQLFTFLSLSPPPLLLNQKKFLLNFQVPTHNVFSISKSLRFPLNHGGFEVIRTSYAQGDDYFIFPLTTHIDYLNTQIWFSFVHHPS